MTSPLFRMGGGGGGGGGRTAGRRWRRRWRRWMGGGGGGRRRGRRGGRRRRAGLIIINRVTVPGPRQVLLHVKIAEINRSATRNIGVSWLYARGKSIFGSAVGNDATFSDEQPRRSSARPSGPRVRRADPGDMSARPARRRRRANSPLFGVFDAGHFSLFIDALRTNSLAKILAEPNLVALDGQPARFLVGGMFPFPVPQSSSIPGGTAVVTVQFQRFGTILTFLPEILPNDVIRLDVEPVISQLNYARRPSVNGGIGPLDHRAERPHRRRAARRPDAGDRRTAPAHHQRHARSASRAWATCRSSAPGSAPTPSRRSRPRRSSWSRPSWSRRSTRRRSPRRPAIGSCSPTTRSSICSAGSKASWAASSGRPSASKTRST